MGTYSSADVKCPFYRRDEPKAGQLTCEGALPASTIKHHFGSKEALQGQLGKYCTSNYERCPWYHIVAFKWEKTEH